MTDRAEVDIRYTAFKDLGRTTISPLDSTVMSSGHATHIGANQIGRYSLHLHHLFGPASPPPNSYQFILIGNAIDGGTKWGITIHNTHYGLVQDNVVYNAAGAGIMTEDGSETANVIQNNFIVRSWGTGHERSDGRQSTGDWGWEGSGIWLRGPDNIVRNNVVANANSFAVTYMMLGVSNVRVPSTPGADPKVSGHPVNMMSVPLREFSSNEFYGVHRGITVWNLGANCCADVYDVPVSTFLNTRMWNVGVLGFYGYGENRVTFDGWVHYNDPSRLTSQHENAPSFYFGDYIARNIVIRQADIQGLRIGIYAPIKAGDTRDIYGSTPGTLVVENSTLKNFWNIYMNTPYGVTGGGSAIPPRLVIARNVQFSNVPGVSGTQGQAHVFRHFTPNQGANQNIIVSDRMVVESFNGNSNDNFEVFANEQAPTFVIPPTPLTTHGRRPDQRAGDERRRHLDLRRDHPVLDHPHRHRRLHLPGRLAAGAAAGPDVAAVDHDASASAERNGAGPERADAHADTDAAQPTPHADAPTSVCRRSVARRPIRSLRWAAGRASTGGLAARRPCPGAGADDSA